MERVDLSRPNVINSLLNIGHGDLSIYKSTGIDMINLDPNFFAHLISYNNKVGKVRDSKAALPVIGLRSGDDEYFENAAAHLCLLDPRNLVKAIRFHKSMPPTNNGAGKYFKEAIRLYLKKREGNIKWFDKTAIQHRRSLKELYALFHIKPSARAQRILFKKEKPQRSIFNVVAQLKNMKPTEAAGTIINYKIPFLIAMGALKGGIKNNSDIILALLGQMSRNELMNNAKLLEKNGVFDNKILKSAFDDAVKKTAKDSRTNALKASVASKAVSGKAKEAMNKVQEDNLRNLSGIEGDWLILGDRSGSMESSIDLAKKVAGFLANQVKGKVYLVFFDEVADYFDVTGKTLDQIEFATRGIHDRGMTSIGVGLDYILSRNIFINGIVICTDGGENKSPRFVTTYHKYCDNMGIEPTVYVLKMDGERDVLSPSLARADIQYEKYVLGEDFDYYSLPNVLSLLKTSRYTMYDEIMESELLTFKDVFK